MGFFDLLFYNFTQFAPMEGTSIFFFIYLFDQNTQNHIIDFDYLSAFHIHSAKTLTFVNSTFRIYANAIECKLRFYDSTHII